MQIVKILKSIKNKIFFYNLGVKRLIRKILNKPTYYVIGDSHTLNFIHEAFYINHVGPATAYKLSFKRSTTNSREKTLKIIEGFYKNKPVNVIFVFGELDARIHIYKYSKENKIAIDKTIARTINSYISFLKYIKKKFPLINIFVFNILPTGEEGNIYNFSFYPDEKQRRDIIKKMNNRLKAQCYENNFSFIYIYDSLVNKGGYRRKEYIHDKVHFNRKIIPFIISELNK